MNIALHTSEIEKYLAVSSVIDYNDPWIMDLSDRLADKANGRIDYIRLAYEFVRDKISHSADINNETVTCNASEVLREGHGICFAKSHLLAALLRYKSIPTGFCYQKLLLDDDTAPILICHGLNGVYLSKYNKWIRLDARGNKSGIHAQFMIEGEQLAFSIRPELGEKDIFTIYSEPDANVLEKLRACKTRTELWAELPVKLAYEE